MLTISGDDLHEFVHLLIDVGGLPQTGLQQQQQQQLHRTGVSHTQYIVYGLDDWQLGKT